VRFQDGDNTELSECTYNSGANSLTRNTVRFLILNGVKQSAFLNLSASASCAIGEGAIDQLPVAIGGTIFGNVTIATSTDFTLYLNAADTSHGSYILGQKAGKNRWSVNLGVDDAETGSNAGSTFQIGSYKDDASYLGTQVSVARASGAVTLSGLGTSPAVILKAPAAPQGDNIFLQRNGLAADDERDCRKRQQCGQQF
jgi:hypothetical protein